MFNPYPSEEGIAAWTVALTIVSGLAFLGGLMFALSYGLFFNWRKNSVGRALFWFIVSLDSVLMVVFLARFLGPDYWGRYQLTFLVYTAVAATVFRLVFTLWQNWETKPEPLILEPRSKYERLLPKKPKRSNNKDWMKPSRR